MLVQYLLGGRFDEFIFESFETVETYGTKNIVNKEISLRIIIGRGL
jgi:hypothetical protein